MIFWSETKKNRSWSELHIASSSLFNQVTFQLKKESI